MDGCQSRNEPEIKSYVCTKTLKASPMTRSVFELNYRKLFIGSKEDDGYRIISPDCTVSWLPKSVFEANHHLIKKQGRRLT